MKKILILSIALVCFQWSIANNTVDTEKSKASVKIEIVDTTINEFSCTIGFKVYVLTQSGIVGFGMSITADTCEEAREGMSDAIAGFISGIY